MRRVIARHVPFDLNESTANVVDVKRLIKSRYTSIESEDDILMLDTAFREINDSIWTRGEFYWNNKRNFYFVDRQMWNGYLNAKKFLPKCRFHSVANNRRVTHGVS